MGSGDEKGWKALVQRPVVSSGTDIMGSLLLPPSSAFVALPFFCLTQAAINFAISHFGRRERRRLFCGRRKKKSFFFFFFRLDKPSCSAFFVCALSY